AGGLCGVVAGPPPCPPPEREGESSGLGGAATPLCPPPEAEGEGSGLGGATAWLRRTSSATAALPNDRCSISRFLGESARATGGESRWRPFFRANPDVRKAERKSLPWTEGRGEDRLGPRYG